MASLVERKEYLAELVGWKAEQVIKVVTGIRRCGKSTLLAQYQDWLRVNGVTDAQIVSVNFEELEYEELLDYKKLYAYLKERLVAGRMTYIFLDEIQKVADFEKVVDSLYAKPDVDIYITGSNAYLLSSEIATLISGRYVEIKMLPLSFREFVSATGDEANLPKAYRQYVESSSFPYALALLDHPKELRDYLEGIYNTVVVKDLASRKKIPDVMMLESVARFVFDSIGSPISTKKIADTMTSSGRKIDVRTAEKYMDALLESFILYQARRYNIRGKQYLKTLEKYYVVDIGLRYMLLGSRSTDVGHILENVIYLELLRRGFEISVGKMDDLEVDFVAVDQKQTIYYQVAATVRDEGTLKRELASLQKINDNYPKFILTLDEDPDADYEGIRRINALEWLMGRE